MSDPALAALAHAPHAHAPTSVGRLMALVMAALLPATLFGFWLYGWPAINLWCVTLAAALLSEAAALRIAGKPLSESLRDGSAALTGWILALSLPPWAPWWIGACGGAFAIVIGKQVFGGVGQNLFNPAMIARVALLISFPLEMTHWVMAPTLFSGPAPGFLDGLAITFGAGVAPADAVTSASLLGHVKSELARGIGLEQALTGQFEAAPALLGMRAGSLGESAALPLLAGGLALLALRVITWHIPLAMLAGVALPAMLMHAIDPARYADAGVHLLAGGLMLGAFFIATDPVTSPNSRAGQLIFGGGCGVLTYIIRAWGGYPEGVAFAVLLMNGATPVIDRYLKPRIYGHAPRIARRWLRRRGRA